MRLRCTTRAAGMRSAGAPSSSRRASWWRASPACCEAERRRASLQTLDVKILDERIRDLLPSYGTPGAAGLDLRACLDASREAFDHLLATRKAAHDMNSVPGKAAALAGIQAGDVVLKGSKVLTN